MLFRLFLIFLSFWDFISPTASQNTYLDAFMNLSSIVEATANEGNETIPLIPVCPLPPKFPQNIPLYWTEFRNYDQDIIVPNLWMANPVTIDDLVALVNWAGGYNYKIRPSGSQHSWSPITVAKPGEASTDSSTKVKRDTEYSYNDCPDTNDDFENGSKTILVKTSPLLTSTEILDENNEDYYATPSVRVQTGVTLDELLVYLLENGYTINGHPAIGGVTIGGILAIGGHGAGLPARGENLKLKLPYGTMSNLVLGFTAIVWDPKAVKYALKTFKREHPHAPAFLTSLGRAFLVEVVLKVVPSMNLCCLSRVDIPARELFVDPTLKVKARSMASFIESSGRVEAIFFPFTANPWVKIWSICPEKPDDYREVTEPYNYPFTDAFSLSMSNAIAAQIIGAPEQTPAFGESSYESTADNLNESEAFKLWGPSPYVNLYAPTDTLRYEDSGWAILTKRETIQRVIFEVFADYQARLNKFAEEGKYPMNGPVEIRVTGIDAPEDVDGLPKEAQAPGISPTRPYKHSGFDAVVWVGMLTFPDTPYSNEFYRETEEFLMGKYNGEYAILRPEWSKGWAYTDKDAWTNEDFIKKWIPFTFEEKNWLENKEILEKYDPKEVYSNEFLKILFQGEDEESGAY